MHLTTEAPIAISTLSDIELCRWDYAPKLAMSSTAIEADAFSTVDLSS
jgi:hypothetical protein